MIRAVLFDKDGTLFRFDETWAVFCARVLDSLAGDDLSLRCRLSCVCGFDEENRRFVPGSLVVAGSLDELCAAWANCLNGVEAENLLRDCAGFLDGLPLVPVCDLPVLFGALQGAGLRLGVATNDTQDSAMAQLEQAGVRDFFDFVCGCDSGFGIKPDPGMVRAFCARVDVTPAEVLVVGDSQHDMICAQRAGVGGRVAVLTGPADHDDLCGCADIVLESIADLPDFLRTWGELPKVC